MNSAERFMPWSLRASPMAVSAALYSYRIYLDGIRFRARHGASEAERGLPQDFVVDLQVTLPIEQLPATDHRNRVYDYDALANLVVQEGTARSYKLLETLARRLIERVLQDSPALATKVRLRKFGPPTTASVDAVAIELSGSMPGVSPSDAASFDDHGAASTYTS